MFLLPGFFFGFSCPRTEVVDVATMGGQVKLLSVTGMVEVEEKVAAGRQVLLFIVTGSVHGEEMVTAGE
jgi:hypothetical protein